MARRPSYPASETRRVLLDFLTYNARWIAVIAGGYALGIVTARLLGGEGYWQGFSEGSLLVVILVAILCLFLFHTDGFQKLAGLWGERSTQGELKRAQRRGQVWGAVHSVQFADGDLDSVAVAPAGLLAIESRWKSKLDRRWLGKDLTDAERAAQRVRSVLRSEKVTIELPVVPVVVLWGRASADVREGGEPHDGVHLVSGHDMEQWLAASPQHVDRASAQQALTALASFAERHRYEPNS